MSEAVRPQPPGDRLMVTLQVDPPGVYDFSGRPNPIVVIHVGPSVQIACQRENRRHSGLSVHGDVDIVPAGVPSRWELRQKDTALVVALPERILRIAANEMDVDPARVALVNRFQLRDRQIEHIGWALKTEMEAGYPNGNLYLDSLATALSLHLLHHHSSLSEKAAQKTRPAPGGMAGHRLKHTISYIEDNLARNLSLEEIANIAGLSVSHCKAAFRNSVGQPIHRYVIQRRVDRAQALLRGGELSISQVALETGFAHQSHLAYHMRRVLGVSPKTIQTCSEPAERERLTGKLMA